MTGHFSATPSKAHRKSISFLPAQSQFLLITPTSSSVILNFPSTSTQMLLNGDLTVALKDGAAEGLGEGLIDTVGELVGFSLGGTLGNIVGNTLGIREGR